MAKRISDFLSGTAMTVVSGAFLALSLALTLSGKSIGLDPAWGSVLISGIPLLYLALWRIRHNRGISKISSALLISIAMFAAIAIGDLFAAGEVAFIMAIGAILEEKTTQRAKKGLRNLLCLVPQQGRRIAEGKEECIPASRIRKNDILRILPGEAVPVDGIILRGETSLDQSIMTGESLPVDKGVGDSVFCGTINRFGVVEIRATKVGEDSSLQKLIHMVQEAESRQAPMQRIADRWASWLVPVALLIALAAYLFSGNIVTGVTILVVFCPCALVLATPTAIMAAIGQATKHGVIIKSGEALERMGKVDTLAFDKTGTITFGRPEVSDIAVFENSLTERELLVLAASAESHSEHPLGKAIVAFAQSEGLGLLPVEDFQMRAGKGISARVGGKKLLCGSERFLRECGIEPETSRMKTLDLLREQGKASILVADEKSCLGVIALADVLRPSAKEIVSDLEKTGARAVLFTGDNRKAAHYFARQAGISAVQAELLPEEKVASIAQLQREGRLVCMIGDGVNDAPALKSADVGVAMGGIGSDIAVDAADIALVGDDLRKLPYLKRLSSATVGTIKLSILLSLCINFVAIVLSLLGVLTPTSGALVHNAGSCLVVLIAALLYDRKFE
ncbi:MAG TPA: cation-translocating P-type ATPase [Candidatus Pullichristensenella excrementigallinarum]|uniref:Cd(2+)-exporting ATPase n=1 Tax=Candidatus Pullichristensenella excrementigallinarum TaxID=2840907 RepID=A0A9D1LBF9_9FIRM|nr:cation-translocating P-type ATPase [Candidatus Pullichristensenella excrementigallinarum]